MSAIEQFRLLAQPPPWALKRIGGGRLKGMTDIKPAWRIQAMTEVYGLCGIGWKYEVVRQWYEQGSEGQVFVFVNVLLYFRWTDDEWSAPIPGTGGSMLVEKEKAGLHSNDEAFKMATTDALSNAMKMIGMGHDIYAGQWTGSKYIGQTEPPPQPVSVENIAELTAAINGATDIEAIKTITNGRVYTQLKANGPADAYQRASKLAKAKAAVLTPPKKGNDNADSGSKPTPDPS